MRGSIVLADFAETDTGSGKVHILGAGWSVINPSPSPQAVVAFIQVPPDRVGEPIPVTLRLADLAGQMAEVPGPAGMQRMEFQGQIEIGTPDEWDGQTDLQATFVVNLMVPLQPGQSYAWLLEADGKELASTRFRVRSSTEP